MGKSCPVPALASSHLMHTYPVSGLVRPGRGPKSLRKTHLLSPPSLGAPQTHGCLAPIPISELSHCTALRSGGRGQRVCRSRHQARLPPAAPPPGLTGHLHAPPSLVRRCLAGVRVRDRPRWCSWGPGGHAAAHGRVWIAVSLRPWQVPCTAQAQGALQAAEREWTCPEGTQG